MFSYHMLLQGSERRPPVESHTKYRPPISMDLKSYSWYKGAHQHNTEGVQSRSSEGRLCSLQVTFYIQIPPNVFKVQGQLQICLNSLFFSSAFGAERKVDGSQQRGVGGARGDRRGESHTVFSPTLGVYISPAPSASDALKDQWRRTVRSNTRVLATLVNKQCFQKNTFVYGDIHSA